MNLAPLLKFALKFATTHGPEFVIVRCARQSNSRHLKAEVLFPSAAAVDSCIYFLSTNLLTEWSTQDAGLNRLLPHDVIRSRKRPLFCDSSWMLSEINGDIAIHADVQWERWGNTICHLPSFVSPQTRTARTPCRYERSPILMPMVHWCCC